MYDFISRVAAAEKFPSLTFGFEPLDPAVLKYYPPMPERVKHAIG
jgi:hypothetical protein